MGRLASPVQYWGDRTPGTLLNSDRSLAIATRLMSQGDSLAKPQGHGKSNKPVMFDKNMNTQGDKTDDTTIQGRV